MAIPTATLPDDGDITARLAQRRVRPIQSSFMNSVIVDLEMKNAEDPAHALQRVARAVIELTGAHSAGVSLLSGGVNGEVLIWRAVSGAWSGHAGLSLPRQGSPCGWALQRGELLLLSRPARHCPAVQALRPPVVEGMYTGFAGRRGVVWALAHDHQLEFDGQDAFMLQEVGLRAAAALPGDASPG
jgi:hypothetical protein